MEIQPQPQVFDVDETNFEELVLKGSSERVIVADFWAPWCGPCKTLGPVLEEVVSELGPGIALAKINVDDNQQLAAAFKVQGIPAVKIVKDGQLAQEFTGALPKDQIDAILQSPISNLELLMVLSLRGVIFGFIQFIFAILVTCALNHEYLGTLSVLMIIIQIMAVILFFSIFGILMGLLISHRTIFIQFSLALFVIITLGMGSFIPISSYPESYVTIINNIPLITVLQNIQSIIIHQTIQWTSFFLTFILTILLFFITLIISNKTLRNI